MVAFYLIQATRIKKLSIMKSFQFNFNEKYQKVFFNKYKAWIRKNWFSLTLLVFAIFILTQKDITMEFSMRANPNVAPIEQPLPTSKEEGKVVPAAAPLSEVIQQDKSETSQQLGWGSLPGLIRNTVSKGNVSTNAKVTNEEAVAAYPNIRFLLFPEMAKSANLNESAINSINNKCKAYARRFAPVAMAEMGRYGVPASITVAQAILHSNAGDDPLAAKSNNHFGIRCFSKECPKGHCSHHGTQAHKSFYRNFNTAWESFRAHSLLLTNKKYEHLLKLDKKDYQGWAKGLQKAGYSKDPQYAAKLIRIIEAMQLVELDV